MPIVSAMSTVPATPPATPPPTYRAISPPPPAYKAAKKAYLTIEDLYMRYAPLRALRSVRQSAHQSACSKATAAPSYLTIHDLFRRFGKRTSAKSMSKQFKQSDTELNQIQLAHQDRYVLDLEKSAIDSVRSRKSNAKTSDICFLPQVQKLHQQRYGAIPTRIPLANTPTRPSEPSLQATKRLCATDLIVANPTPHQAPYHVTQSTKVNCKSKSTETTLETLGYNLQAMTLPSKRCQHTASDDVTILTSPPNATSFAGRL